MEGRPRNNVVSSITVAFQVVISLLINFCLSCCTRQECSEIRASTSQKQARAYKACTIFESCRLVLMLLPLVVESLLRPLAVIRRENYRGREI